MQSNLGKLAPNHGDRDREKERDVSGQIRTQSHEDKHDESEILRLAKDLVCYGRETALPNGG